MPHQNHDQHTLAAIEVDGISRSSFLLRGVLATGAALGAGAVTPFVSQAASMSGTKDLDILNFALTLEYLETDFYVVHGKALNLSSDVRKVAREFGEQESAHVDALTKAIRAAGGKPVKKPKFAFPSKDEKSFLELALVLENTGVSAYNGAGPSLKNKDYLGAAGSIVQVEARHAAAIALMIDENPTPDGAFDKPLSTKQVLKAVTPLLA